jgi:hypothetical protein
MPTKLVQAIEEGDLDSLESALDNVEYAAAAVNEEDPETWLSPLHHAALRGAVDAAKLLLSKGGDPNLEDIKGRTCLHVACDAYAANETGDFWQGGNIWGEGSVSGLLSLYKLCSFIAVHYEPLVGVFIPYPHASREPPPASPPLAPLDNNT